MEMKTSPSSENIQIRMLTDRDPLWDQIHSSAVYSIYHQKIWKDLIEASFRHTGMYLASVKNGMLLDVLPFFLIKNFLLGKKLVSTPYEGCNGGFRCTDRMVRKKLVDQIRQYALDMRVNYIEIRSGSPIDELREWGFIEKTPLLISETKLTGPDENWQMLSPNHRRNVRYAQKKGVVVEPAVTLEEMKIFYRILADHYRELGVPFFNERLFVQIWEKLIQKQYACLLLARLKDEIIGGHLLFFSGKTLISKYSAYKKDKEYQKLYASYALIWEGLRLGIINDFENYSLGVTGESNRGLLQFKSSFGSETRPVYFYYYPIKGGIPDLGKYYGEYSLLKKIWGAAPRFLTSPIGQKINAWIC